VIGEPLVVRPGLEIPAAELEWDFSRSGGPGGQSVNTADTRARVRFAPDRSTALSEGVRRRLRAANGRWLTAEGDLVITSDEHRSRLRNIETVRERLAVAIREALEPPTQRRATRPTRSSQQRRVSGKKLRGAVKSGRKPPKGDD
jgi:ribosome-associated protein